MNIYPLTDDKNGLHLIKYIYYEVIFSDFERKEVWHSKWSSDTPSSLAIMEKQKLIFIENEKPEDPIITNSYICDFSNM